MIILAVAAAVILGLVPAVIASEKGHSVRLWWVFGAVLFPVALLVALLLPTTERALRRRDQDRARDEAFRECPSCHDDVRSEATVCPYCQLPVLPTRTAIGNVRSMRAATH